MKESNNPGDLLLIDAEDGDEVTLVDVRSNGEVTLVGTDLEGGFKEETMTLSDAASRLTVEASGLPLETLIDRVIGKWVAEERATTVEDAYALLRIEPGYDPRLDGIKGFPEAVKLMIASALEDHGLVTA